ncbi:MAG: tetratricopeptide repeat protein, partial [Terriglobia bacterium]
GYVLCHEIFGFEAFGFHLVNVAFHAAVVCLVFLVTRRVFKDRALAFVAAALFALHPIHTEAVDWIAAVTDLELTFFFLLAFWFFLRLGDGGGRRKLLLHAGMLASFILALLSKEPAATLPFVATLYEHACRDDRKHTSESVKASRYGALWLVLIAYLVWRTRVLGLFAPVASRPEMSTGAAALSAFALTGRYIEKLFWPVHLSAAYVFPASIGVLLPRILAGFAVAAACALLMIWFWGRERRVFFGFAWFFLTLAPVLNARWMPDFVFAERYLYLPSVGFCWIVCWLALRAARSTGKRGSIGRGVVWKRVIVAAACLLAALMAARIVIRNRDWKNDFIFYTRTLQAAPSAAILHNDLGNYYWDRGNLAAAAAQWQAAFRINPGAVYVLDNLALLRLRQKRYGEAVAFFERALAVTRKDETAREGLGEAYLQMGMSAQAEEELLAAIKLAPLDVRARTRLGELYFDERRYGEAATQFRAAIRSLPTLRAYFGLGLTDWVRGNPSAAEGEFKAAHTLDPSDSRTDFMLGLLYGASGRTSEAIREYQAGLKLDPGNQSALAALARLQSEGGPRGHVAAPLRK